MKRNAVSVIAGFLLAITLCGPLAAQQQNTHLARPGSINYVEGQASIGNVTLSPNSVGSVTLEAGQTLTTQAGKVEILLTPGVFLRLADNSTLKMVSPDLVNTEVSLEHGRAMVEALEVRKENDIRIALNEGVTRIEKNGLYDFDADNCQVRVFKGSAEVKVNDENIKVGGNRELTLNAPGKLKARDFEPREYQDEFFRWSALRSGYLSEAGVDVAREYVGPGPGWYGPGWYGPGWYWDSWWAVWTFLPADGIYYSPFGWGFYSPIWVYRSPFFYWGYWGHAPHPFNEYHAPFGHGFEPRGGFHGGFGGGVPHGGAPGGASHGGGHR